MIITRVDGQLLVVRQTDHGDQTGLFAQGWGNEVVPPIDEHRHEHSATLAARHHDDGWAVWERRPTLHEHTHQPYQFTDLPPAEHLALYRAGIERAAQHDPLAGVLVSMHGAGLYNDRYGTFRLVEQHFTAEEQALVDEFLADMQALQDGLAAKAGHHPIGHASDDPTIRGLYLTLQVWDRLSLQFAYRLAADGRIGPLAQPVGERVPITELHCTNLGAFELLIDPYPFVDGRMVFPVAARRVPDRAYRNPEDFVAELAAATPLTIECTVRSSRT